MCMCMCVYACMFKGLGVSGRTEEKHECATGLCLYPKSSVGSPACCCDTATAVRAARAPKNIIRGSKGQGGIFAT